MTIDTFLPPIVRQAIASQKSDNKNVSGAYIPQTNDPSGEERRGEKGKPSPAAHSQPLATPPFAEYFANQKTQSHKTQNQQGNPYYNKQDVPPVISDFLNDISKKYGVAPPSPQQIQSAYQSSQTYQPKPIVVVTNEPETHEKPAPQQEQPKEQAAVQQRTAPRLTSTKKRAIASHRMIANPIVLHTAPQKTKAAPIPVIIQTASAEKSAPNFDELSPAVQQKAYDYGRMLEALNHYQVQVKKNAN